ncbi:MAG: hypothetical protein HRU16_07450 [Planctomycetes bacterium]|nr:hypothetical protein [Planctomycetota bacterium]
MPKSEKKPNLQAALNRAVDAENKAKHDLAVKKQKRYDAEVAIAENHVEVPLHEINKRAKEISKREDEDRQKSREIIRDLRRGKLPGGLHD